MNDLEKDIPGSNWQSIWKIWFDMECDWTREYVNKMFKPSKIDQVLNFYGIPFIYKNEYKKYLKYRIQARHYDIVNGYFLTVLRNEWYDVSDFNYWTLQDEYNQRVPVAEHTWLDLHINYDLFLKKDQEHRAAISKESETKKDQQIESMQQMMHQMMKQMEQLQKQTGQTNVLLPNSDNNGPTTPSWSDSTTNATNNWDQETPLQTDGENGEIREDWEQNTGWTEWLQWSSEQTQWTEQLWSQETNWDDWFTRPPEPFKIWWGETTATEKPTKDWRTT